MCRRCSHPAFGLPCGLFPCGAEGEWRDGMYHGRGKYLSRDSDEYDGEWREDKMCGNGKYLYRESGDVYACG